MPAMEIYRFSDAQGNIIRYLFDPEQRDEAGEGPVSLERIVEIPEGQPSPTFELDSAYFINAKDGSASLERVTPKSGTELYRYKAKDGGDVRYYYDVGSVNGKNYVVAIHRPPENWQRLRSENLAVANEHSAEDDMLRDEEWRREKEYRKDSVQDEDEMRS
jgi:hypothetical protein